MTDQTYINPDGSIGAQPLTWDGEPMFSPATVAERLFAADAFEQMPGQMALEPACKKCGEPAVYPKYATPDMCERCNREAWERIDAANRDLPGVPGNDVTNVWD